VAYFVQVIVKPSLSIDFTTPPALYPADTQMFTEAVVYEYTPAL